jgi:peptidoglycan hydrolase-like protein with peptidoglycan-binding domain
MEEINISASLLSDGKTLSVFPGKSYKVIVHPSKMSILEVEDMVFRTGSAVFLPDYLAEDGTSIKTTTTVRKKQMPIQGLAVLKTGLMYAKESTTKERLLCTGHADPAYTTEYNRTLSQYRSWSTMSLMAGKREKWLELFTAPKKNGVSTYKDDDIQHILLWASNAKSWDCSPGKVDGDIGKKTKEAIKKFKESYNKEFNKSITGNDAVNDDLWGAFFDVMEDELKKMIVNEGADLESTRKSILWFDESGDSVKSCTACGETFPIEDDKRDNYRSLESRRVELLFITEWEKIELSCIEGACLGKKCPIYGKLPSGKPKIPGGHIIPKPHNTTGTNLIIKVTDCISDTPVDGQPFTISWGDGDDNSKPGVVENGFIKADIPEGTKDAKLILWLDDSKEKIVYTTKLIIEDLEPVDKDKGVQQRLVNLGFEAGPIDGAIGPLTCAAIKQFQYYAKMKVTGIADTETRKKLVEIYGS